MSALRFENVERENSNFDRELMLSAFDSIELNLRSCRHSPRTLTLDERYVCFFFIRNGVVGIFFLLVVLTLALIFWPRKTKEEELAGGLAKKVR